MPYSWSMGCQNRLQHACPQNYGEHGRELITVEVALRLLQLLADPSEVLERADRPGGLGAAHLSSVLHNTVFKVGQYLHTPLCLH